MTKRTRTILFWALSLLFFLATPTVIMYSQGYRIDFGEKKLSRTGGLFVKTLPKQAEVYIDGKLAEKTDFFFGTSLTENLLPKKHQIKLAKEGFLSWEKTLEIKEKGVAEAKSVVLLPAKPDFTVLAKEADGFFFSPDGKKIILEGKTEQGWRLTLLELDKNVQSFLAEKQGEFLDLIWSADSKKAITETASGEQIKYYLLDLEKSPSKNLVSLDFLGKNIQKPSFNPENNQKLFFLKETSLYEGDLNKKEVRGPLLEKIITYEIFGDKIYFLENSGFLYKSDLSFDSKEKINEIPFSAKNETDYEIIIAQSYFFLRENSVLFVLSPDKKSFETFFEPIKNMNVSPDAKKMAYFSDNEISVLFLKDTDDQPKRKAGDKVFVARFSEKINDVFWLTSHYLIFNIGDSVKAAEIDDRDRLQVWDLINFKNPELFYNYNDKKLYILSEGNLYSSEKLLP